MFEAMNFIHYLKYMGIGMLGVFIIIGIIIGATYAISKLSSLPSKKNEENE